MDFDFEDCYYLYIENINKSIIKLQRDYEWSVEVLDGVDFDLGTLFSNMDLDEIVDSLRKKFEVVDIIDENEIDNINMST